jgi:CRISPR/Cas system Type II protein with McrA/HNH and RuvC-like nuclease domain
MKLEVLRFSSGRDSTSGALFSVVEGVKTFLCYTLEDEYRDNKVYSETRIPAGIYHIQFRTVGSFHQKYSSRFQDIHKGMLHIVDVPGFDYILIHCGNTDEHTAGCLLVGDTQHNNMVEEDGFIGRSTAAYKRIYPKIAKALEQGEEVTITYIDYN